MKRPPTEVQEEDSNAFERTTSRSGAFRFRLGLNWTHGLPSPHLGGLARIEERARPAPGLCVRIPSPGVRWLDPGRRAMRGEA